VSKAKTTTDCLDDLKSELESVADWLKPLRRAIDNDEMKIEQLESKIDELQNQVAELELQVEGLRDELEAVRKGDR
jgi:predicted  nucleic acid-binding Zn-ribbon protein